MKSELEEAEEYANKFFTLPGDDWLLGAVGRAHVAGQKAGEKRGHLRALEEVQGEIQRLISIGHAEIGVMQNLYCWLSNKLKEGA